MIVIAKNERSQVVFLNLESSGGDTVTEVYQDLEFDIQDEFSFCVSPTTEE